MSIMNVDTDLVEQIVDVCRFATVALEEAEATLRATYSEMGSDMNGYYGLPQFGNVVNETRITLDRVSAIRDRLANFETLLMTIQGEYADLENQHIHVLEKVSAQIVSINTMIQGVLSKDYPVGITEGEQNSKVRQLEQSLTNTVVGMEMANLSAVSRTTKEEYFCEKVAPIGNTTVVFNNSNDSQEEE